MARISITEKFKKTFSLLEKHFGRRESYKAHPPVEQALVTLLLKGGREGSAERAIRRLERHFVDLNEARVCDPEQLDAVLGRGFPPGVGQLVSDTLTAIFNGAQAMNLDEVMALDPESAEARLKKLRLLPSRVAGELLLASLGYKKIPEGAGILRVARRTKLIRNGLIETQVRSIRRIVPNSLKPRAFHAFEMLAERICTPKDFECRRCPITQCCPTGAETLRRLAIHEEKERAAREVEEHRLTKKRQRERRARARRRTATAKLKRAIQVRSKKLKISPTKEKARRRTRARPVVPAGTKMVQASSADVKPDRAKRRKRSSAKPKRRARSSVGSKKK